jgi:hypothetical protein
MGELIAYNKGGRDRMRHGIVLDAVASEEVWICHCLFGLLDPFNYMKILKRSNILPRIASKDAPTCNYTVNGHAFTRSMAMYITWGTI